MNSKPLSKDFFVFVLEQSGKFANIKELYSLLDITRDPKLLRDQIKLLRDQIKQRELAYKLHHG